MDDGRLKNKVRWILSKITQIVNYAAIIGVFYILLYQIEALRNFCKMICEYIIGWFLLVELSDIKALYFLIEKGFKVAIVLSIILSLLSTIIRNIRESRLKNKTGETRFEKSVFRYLHDTAVPRCFLVTGQWGSGKSYEIKRFFDKYYYNTKIKVYRVSCFGLSSRKELIDEINGIIGQNDKSFYSQIVKVLQYLPVIGEAINKVLKKSHGYDSIDKGSIFIFDDFERITSRPINELHSGRLYEQSYSFRRWNRGYVRDTELGAIKEELDSVGKAFNGLEDSINRNSLSSDYDKYIAISGFINELIEVYGMKVIVVCNTEFLGEKFVHEVLRSKLNCIEYKKIITQGTKTSIIERIFESRVFDDGEKQGKIEQYLTLFKENIDSIKLDDRFKDMRLFGGLIEAFMDTAILFDKEILTEIFLDSLMNSIMITHLGYYNNSYESLDGYVNGANIEFLIHLFGGTTYAENLVRLCGCDENIRWIDERVSGYWILNLSVPNDISDICEEWKNYEYSDLEKRMLLNPRCMRDENEYDLMHILFYEKKCSNDPTFEMFCEKFVRKVLSRYELSKIEVIQSTLDSVYRLWGEGINKNLLEIFFEILAEGNAKGEIEGDTYIHKEYNKVFGKKSS